MHFLKTLFWVMVAVIAAVFAMRNWTVVTLNLSGGLRLDAKLPVLLLIAFLIGWLPTFVMLQAARWRYRRRLDASERALADLRTLEPAPPPVAVEEPPLHRPLHAAPGGTEP